MNKLNYLVVPDIHGQISQYNQVEIFIKKILKEDSSIHIVFLGDYVDRGESGKFEYYDKNEDDYVEKDFLDIGSRLVVEKLLALETYFIENNITYTFLMGNHEESFICNVKNIESFSSRKNSDSSKDYMSMYQTLIGFTQDFNLINKTVAFFEKMPYYYCDNDNKLFFVHAGVNPDNIDLNNSQVDVLKSLKSDYLNIREKFFTSSMKFSHQVIFGHTPIDSINDVFQEKSYIHDKYKIILKDDRIGLDSGNYRNGYINVLRINKEKYTLLKIDKQGVRATYDLE